MRLPSFEDASFLSQSYIAVSENEEERMTIARTIAAAAVCRSARNLPCGKCPSCIKAAAGNHPDIRIIRTGGDKDSKTVTSVKQVRDTVLDASILPNESTRRVFIFADGDSMPPISQNAALKLLEEPPESAVIILCASRAEKFLQTVRSRCTEISGNAMQPASEDGVSEAVEGYVRAVASGKVTELFRFCESVNSMKIPEAREFVLGCAGAFTDMLCRRRDPLGMTDAQQMRIVRLMERCAGYLAVNVGVKQIMGLIEAGSIERRNREEG